MSLNCFCSLGEQQPNSLFYITENAEVLIEVDEIYHARRNSLALTPKNVNNVLSKDKQSFSKLHKIQKQKLQEKVINESKRHLGNQQKVNCKQYLKKVNKYSLKKNNHEERCPQQHIHPNQNFENQENLKDNPLAINRGKRRIRNNNRHSSLFSEPDTPKNMEFNIQQIQHQNLSFVKRKTPRQDEIGLQSELECLFQQIDT